MKIQVCFTLPNNVDINNTVAWNSYKEIQDVANISCVIVKGASICINRNKCIIGNGPELIKQTGFAADKFLFIDYDISFNLDNICKLLKYNKDVISGTYLTRGGEICAGYWGKIDGLSEATVNKDLNGLQKVDWIGAGFLMISKEVLAKVEYPWFRPYIVTHDNRRSIISEDLGFCKYMKENMVQPYLSMDCQVKHCI